MQVGFSVPIVHAAWGLLGLAFVFVSFFFFLGGGGGGGRV